MQYERCTKLQKGVETISKSGGIESFRVANRMSKTILQVRSKDATRSCVASWDRFQRNEPMVLPDLPDIDRGRPSTATGSALGRSRRPSPYLPPWPCWARSAWGDSSSKHHRKCRPLRSLVPTVFIGMKPGVEGSECGKPVGNPFQRMIMIPLKIPNDSQMKTKATNHQSRSTILMQKAASNMVNL